MISCFLKNIYNSITVKGAPFSPMIGSLRFNLSPASFIHLLGNLLALNSAFG